MRGVLLLLLAVGLCAGAAGCYTAPVMPPSGWVYSQVRAPLDTDLARTSLGKSGEASTTCILGMVATGDCSVQAAAKSAGLTTVNHADYEYYNVLGVYQRFTVRVYGN